MKKYKCRKRCHLCKKIFYPMYSGTYYCDDCKKRKGAYMQTVDEEEIEIKKNNEE